MKVSRNCLNKPHRIFEGRIFLGYSPPFERGANLLGWGESPVTKAWENSSTFLKIISCPPNTSLPLKCPPPNSEAWRGGVRGSALPSPNFIPRSQDFLKQLGFFFIF